MSSPLHRALAHRVYYGWVVVGITVLTLLLSAGVRSAPGVLIHPLEEDLGWTRTELSFAVSIGLILTGLAAPFGGALMDRIGPRRVMLGGLVLIAGSLAGGAAMTELWQLTLFWGVVSGIGTGVVATVLGATVATRWFVTRRGMVLGAMSAAASAGQLIFVPLLMWLVVAIGWRSATLVMMGCALALVLPVLMLMRDAPGDVGLLPYGATGIVETGAAAQLDIRATLRRATRVPEFWLLAGSFFICGATSNGLVGTHLIPHAIDHGIPEVTAAGVLAVMGAMNFTGTLASGWLTDRYDPRKLLACYYTFRGVSLFLVPFVTDVPGLTVFAIVFGLDYIATVPPTVSLTADIFGKRHVGLLFGWIFCAHQLGAAGAAYLGGVARDTLGDYNVAFLSAGALAVAGGMMALRIDRRPLAEMAPAPAQGAA